MFCRQFFIVKNIQLPMNYLQDVQCNPALILFLIKTTFKSNLKSSWDTKFLYFFYFEYSIFCYSFLKQFFLFILISVNVFFEPAAIFQGKIIQININPTKMLKVLCLLAWTGIQISSALYLTTHFLNAQDLLYQHDNVVKNADVLHEDFKTVNEKLAKAKNTDDKIRILEESIARQKGMIGQLSRATIISLDDGQWTCPEWQHKSERQLAELVDSISTNANKIDEQISKLDEKSVKNVEEMKNDANEVKNYSDEISKSLKASGKIIPPKQMDVSNQTNFIADDVVIENPQDLQKKIQAAEKSNDYVRTCPLDKPYFDGQACITCPSTHPQFNIGTNECFSCPDYDQTNQLCPSLTKYDGYNLDKAASRMILPEGVTFDAIKKKNGQNTCPSYRPFFVNDQCIECESPNSLFDYQTSKCSQCPKNTIYESTKMKCIIGEQFVTNIATADDRVVLPPTKTIDDLKAQQKKMSETANIENCPNEKPFYNGKTCIDCAYEQYFWVEKNSCDKCPDGTIYKAKTHACQKTIFYSNLENPYWTSTNVQKIKKQNDQLSNNKQNTKCPLKNPFYDGSKCISCSKDEVFSFDAEKCTKCTSGTQFNKNMHVCVNPQKLYQTNPLTAPNLIYGGVSRAEWAYSYRKVQEVEPSVIDCPTEKPFFDGIICISCPVDKPYFNLLDKSCSTCDKGSEYDSSVHECLSDEGNIVTQTPNIEKMAAGIFA